MPRSRDNAIARSAQMEKLIEVISRSQQGYRELIDHLDQAVFTLSLDGEIRVANLPLAQLFRVPIRDLIGHPLDEFLDDPSRGELIASIPRLLERGSWSGQVAIRLKHEDGVRHFDCQFLLVPGDNRESAITGWARDVTAQHETELRASELFESLHEAIVFTKPDGRVLDANPAFLRLFGYQSKEELQQHKIQEIWEDVSVRERLIKELLEKQQVRDVVLAMRRKDGRRIHCLASGFAIRDSRGHVERLQATLVDISGRLEIERKLREEQQFVKRLLASLPDVTLVLNEKAHITYVSQSVLDMLGRSPQDFSGKTLDEIAAPEDAAGLSGVLQSVLGGRAIRNQAEFRARDAAGNWRILRASCGPLYGDEARITGVVVSIRDATETKQAEQHLALRQRAASMGEMISGAVHELNNPLTAILAAAELLRDESAEGASRRQLDLIVQQARRAAAIIGNLIAFSRPAATARKALDVRNLLETLIRRRQEALRRQGIGIQLSSPSAIPAIEGDPKLLTQAFQNILLNAEQALSAKPASATSAAPAISVEISAPRDSGKICVAISDRGRGIAPEDLDKIFDPFFTTKRPGGGAGLGLTIALAVVKQHGGVIEVESVHGEGTVVRALLPVAAVVAEPPLPGAAPEVSRALASEAEPLSVLVVDDEEGIRGMIEDALTSRGIRVRCTENPEQALDAAVAASYDLILCDFNLPGMPGPQLLEKLRTGGRNTATRFVLMTGQWVDPGETEALQREGIALLQKPFPLSALVHLVEQLPSRVS